MKKLLLPLCLLFTQMNIEAAAEVRSVDEKLEQAEGPVFIEKEYREFLDRKGKGAEALAKIALIKECIESGSPLPNSEDEKLLLEHLKEKAENNRAA